MHHFALRTRCSKVAAVLVFLLAAAGCGHSKEEWEQQLRESSILREQLAARERATVECATRQASVHRELDQLHNALVAGGFKVDSLAADLKQQQVALREYQQRKEQLKTYSELFASLRDGLQDTVSREVDITARRGHVMVDMPGHLLFAAGNDIISERGHDILRQVARVIRQDRGLAERSYQVVAHVDQETDKAGHSDKWSLCAMRARAVLLALTRPVEEGGGGLDAELWSLAAYADSNPLATRDARRSTLTNGRVEIVMQPDADERLNVGRLAR